MKLVESPEPPAKSNMDKKTEPKTLTPAGIFDYFDFREFLRDAYKAKKKANPVFSYRYMAQKVNLDAGSLSRIFKGERNLDPETADKIAKLFGLSGPEKDYFVALVLYGQAKSHAEKSHLLESLLSRRGSTANTLAEYQYEFYREWYYSALRELLNIHHFDGDHARLARILRPSIMPGQAEKALHLLHEIGLVEKDGNG